MKCLLNRSYYNHARESRTHVLGTKRCVSVIEIIWYVVDGLRKTFERGVLNLLPRPPSRLLLHANNNNVDAMHFGAMLC